MPVLTEATVLDRGVREAPVGVDRDGAGLAGVLCRPERDAERRVALLLLNAGAINRVGPNRLWVEAARRWAARGVPSLRLDVEGIGDADGDASDYVTDAGLYVPELVDQVLDGARALEAEAPGAQLVCVGLCSGAYWGFHAALRTIEVGGVVMLNPRAIFWDEELEQSHNARFVRRVLGSRSTWRRVLRGEIPRARLAGAARLALRSLTWHLRGGSRTGALVDPTIDAFDRLRDAGVNVVMAFGRNEPLHDELAERGLLEQPDRWPRLRLEELPGAVHTLQSLQAQAAAHALIDREVERLL